MVSSEFSIVYCLIFKALIERDTDCEKILLNCVLNYLCIRPRFLTLIDRNVQSFIACTVNCLSRFKFFEESLALSISYSNSRLCCFEANTKSNSPTKSPSKTFM